MPPRCRGAFAACSLALIAMPALAPAAAWAQDGQAQDDADETASAAASGGWHSDAAPSSGEVLARDFGPLGLTAEINSDEYFGSLQAQLGAYTAIDEGDDPALSVHNIVMPAHLTVPLDANAHWFVKLGAALIHSWADDHGETLEDTGTMTSLAQIQYRPWAGTLIGVGATYEHNKVHLAEGGSIGIDGNGFRFDLLQRINQHIGLSTKVTWFDGETKLQIPLSEDLTLYDTAASPRTYAQIGLIGRIGHQDMAFVPEGWTLRPMVHAIFQRTVVAASTNSLGVAEERSRQDYGQVMVNMKLEKEEFRSGKLAPFVDMGAILRVADTIPTPASDPVLAYAKAGVATHIGGWGFLDAYYAYRDSLDGHYKSGTAEVLLSITL